MTDGPDLSTLPLEAFAYDAAFTAAEYAAMRAGLSAESMDDKWRITWADDHLTFQRSWTGMRIYRLRFRTKGDRHYVAEALVCADDAHYHRGSDDFEAAQVDFLIRGLMLHQDVTFPVPADVDPEVHGIYQHHVVGRAFPVRVLAAPPLPWTRRLWNLLLKPLPQLGGASRTRDLDEVEVDTIEEARRWSRFNGHVIDDKYRIDGVMHEWPDRARLYAERLATGDPVCIDVTSRGALGDDDRARFLRNGEMVARMFSAAPEPIVRALLDVGLLEDDLPFTVDRARGEPLSARMQRSGRLHFKDAAALVNLCAPALMFAHAHGVVHGAISLDAIAVWEDWASADLFWPVATFTGTMPRLDRPFPVLTRQNMDLSPEQFMGAAVDTATDVYLLGGVMYELLTGAWPFVGQANWRQRSLAVIKGELIPLRAKLRNCPPPLDDLVARCLSVQREQRPSLTELVQALAAL